VEKIRVLIVEDHPIVREGLRSILLTDQAIEIVGEARDGSEAVTKLAEMKPNVILMDVGMPNMDGIEATRRIKDKSPSVAVIILTMYDKDTFVIDAVRAGASGYLLKDTSRELLLHTVQAVSSGATLIESSLLSEAISSLVASTNGHKKPRAHTATGLESLTPRELEVLKLLTEGRANRDIGEELGIAQATVKKHMQSIIAKLDASNRIDAAMKAARAGIIK